MNWIAIGNDNVFRTPFYLCSAALVLAMLPWPWGFLALFKVVICACTAYGAWRMYQRESAEWTWTLGVLAVVFNPLVPVRIGGYLPWLILTAVALVLVYAAALAFQGRSIREVLG